MINPYHFYLTFSLSDSQLASQPEIVRFFTLHCFHWSVFLDLLSDWSFFLGSLSDWSVFLGSLSNWLGGGGG